MKKTTFSQYAIDNASILYLSLIRKDHSNTYRFTVKLTDDIDPEVLQEAVNRIYKRFPTVIAGFRPGFFQYYQIPAQSPPLVQRDPGCLITTSKEELHKCAYRVYYHENNIAIEAFHALTDGYGAIASFTTLVAEYLKLKYGAQIPICMPLFDIEEPPTSDELEDSYLRHKQGKPLHLPSRYAYQLPGGNAKREAVQISTYTIPTNRLLAAARRYGVSITTLLSTIMAISVMDVQKKYNSGTIRPVRIMVPVDLRKIFSSRSLRNFILYVLPTMEPSEHNLPFEDLLHRFSDQMHVQVNRERLASIMAYNVKTQSSWYFRMIPMPIKSSIMRLAYRFFGESNSSVTLTNLGNVTLPDEMKKFVEHIDVTLTPRMRSPYNCAILSYEGQLSINISRFPKESELEEIFYKHLSGILNDEVAP